MPSYNIPFSTLLPLWKKSPTVFRTFLYLPIANVGCCSNMYFRNHSAGTSFNSNRLVRIRRSVWLCRHCSVCSIDVILRRKCSAGKVRLRCGEQITGERVCAGTRTPVFRKKVGNSRLAVAPIVSRNQLLQTSHSFWSGVATWIAISPAFASLTGEIDQLAVQQHPMLF